MSEDTRDQVGSSIHANPRGAEQVGVPHSHSLYRQWNTRKTGSGIKRDRTLYADENEDRKSSRLLPRERHQRAVIGPFIDSLSKRFMDAADANDRANSEGK
mmetsp:Transcript_30184/g.68064  ORF Transcript_30184/g.68064 Transcript_30184/m.68064 type:complete len:101 (+) Transcript_30184:2035-2337(+)